MRLTEEEKRFLVAVLSQSNWNVQQKREFQLAGSIVEKLSAQLEAPRPTVAELKKITEEECD